MQENRFEELLKRAEAEINESASSRNLNEIKAKFLGKNGEITMLLRGMRDIPPEKRSEFGKAVNELK